MTARTTPRLSHSQRKHIRRIKAALRRELGFDEAKKAIERQLRGVRR